MDEDKLSPNARLLEIVLLCCHECNVIGLYPYNEQESSRLSGLLSEELPPILDELERTHRIRRSHGYILVIAKWAERVNPYSKPAYDAAGKILSRCPAPVSQMFFKAFSQFSRGYDFYVLGVPLEEKYIREMNPAEFDAYLSKIIKTQAERDRLRKIYGTPEYFESRHQQN
jgi:hypothetical protein